jgi:putative drug exporter of the RND superfamily
MTGLLKLETGLSGADQFLDKPEAIVAAERLGESFPAGSSDPIQILTRQDPQQVIAAVRGLDGVVAAEVAAAGDGVAQVDVVVTAAPGSDAAADSIRAVRASLSDLSDTFVGGTEAQALDAADTAARDRLVILPLIVVLVLGALVLLLRSVVAPVLLVLTVVATYLASLGLSWWVFTELLGFPALDVGVPLLAFLFLVALGVDYNIFLVTRAREEARVHGAVAGMLRALTATGGVITSAGILLAAVFAVLGVLPLVVLAQLGLVICIGVLLDTLLVRTVVVPALGVALGERFWWPRRVTESAPAAERPDLASTSA